MLKGGCIVLTNVYVFQQSRKVHRRLPYAYAFANCTTVKERLKALNTQVIWSMWMEVHFMLSCCSNGTCKSQRVTIARLANLPPPAPTKQHQLFLVWPIWDFTCVILSLFRWYLTAFLNDQYDAYSWTSNIYFPYYYIHDQAIWRYLFVIRYFLANS